MQQETFWVQKEKASYPILRGRQTADAAVIGGGLTGVTTALWLCRAGLRVTLLEAETLGSGASARCAGMLTLTGGMGFRNMARKWGNDRTHQYAATQLNAYITLRELARSEGMDPAWQDADAQLVASAPQEVEQLEREAEAMRDAGLAASFARSTQCPLPADAALTVQGMGAIDPARFLRRMVDKAVKKGLKIHEHSRVIALETNLASTERGSVQAPYIVVATGYPIVNVPGWYFLRLRQRQSWLVPLMKTARFDGMFFDFRERYAIRKARQGTLFTLNGGYAGNPGNSRVLEDMKEEWLPLMEVSMPETVYGGLDTVSGDGLPYIGPYSRKTPNLFVATGYNGRGILGSMVAAQSISARVMGLPSEEYDVYLASRDRLPVGRQTAEMAGIYAKDHLFHPSAPRCPHMGCKLRYDASSNLWVCPCHGSQFDNIGHLLNAPAVHDAVLNRRGGR